MPGVAKAYEANWSKSRGACLRAWVAGSPREGPCGEEPEGGRRPPSTAGGGRSERRALPQQQLALAHGPAPPRGCGQGGGGDLGMQGGKGGPRWP